MLKILVPGLAVLLAASGDANAHGIAGNRYFPGTLTFDDPAVADELILPDWSHFQHRDDYAWSFARLLTPWLAAGADGGYVKQDGRSGWGVTSLNIKSELYRNDPSESLIAASFGWGIPHSGAQAIGANSAGSFQPAIAFGQGFGALPAQFAFLRPFAVTGAAALEIPARATTVNFGAPARTPLTWHWGFSISYSTLYLTDRFTGDPPAEEPLNQLLALVEFAFDSPRGQRTTGTINPGLSYVAITWQIGVEAIVPINRFSGRGTGARAQLLLFLDDLVPSLFENPVFAR